MKTGALILLLFFLSGCFSSAKRTKEQLAQTILAILQQGTEEEFLTLGVTEKELTDFIENSDLTEERKNSMMKKLPSI